MLTSWASRNSSPEATTRSYTWQSNIRCSTKRQAMRHRIVVAMLLLLVSGYATPARAADSQPCEWWYLGVLRYVFPLAIALDAFGSNECQWQYDGNASLAKALDLTPHKP